MITISLCMIVKNEENVLARILEPMKNIADEIIIVDTGSTDRTKEIANTFTPLVFDFPWNQDFAAARNFAAAKTTMDFWMWLDADDVITPKNQAALLHLKETVSPDTDMVMMNYITDFDEDGNPSFSFYRERLIKNHQGTRWSGKVHEAIPLSGNILYAPIEIEHRKESVREPDRNLNIYENMIQNNEVLEPRHQFYYARELYYHARYQQAITAFKKFLKHPGGWSENKIDACLLLSRCCEQTGQEKEGLRFLFESFFYDIPRAEICCEIGRLMIQKQQYAQAVYWYQQALSDRPREHSGAFIQKDCYGYIPYIQLCVCYDRLGQFGDAYRCHRLSMDLKPDSDAVLYNQQYFEREHPDLLTPPV